MGYKIDLNGSKLPFGISLSTGILSSERITNHAYSIFKTYLYLYIYIDREISFYLVVLKLTVLPIDIIRLGL